MRHRESDGGFTILEVTIILMVLVTLGTIMMPQLGNYNRLARFTKAKEDLTAICSVMKEMLDEVMLGTFYGEPRSRALPIGLLVGPGAIPQDGMVARSNWQLPLLEEFWEQTDREYESVEFITDTFGHHLQQNNALAGGRRINRYKNPFDDPGRTEAGAFFGWRGPYFDAFTPDPWGNRYMANVFALYRPPDGPEGDLFTSAVVCYSVGPDGGVDTVFNQPMSDDDGDGVYGWVAGADDLAVVFSAGGPF